MYLKGYPGFYYTIQQYIRKKKQLPPYLSQLDKFRDLVTSNEGGDTKHKCVPRQHFFEAGISMKRVGQLLDGFALGGHNTNLRHNFFSRALHQDQGKMLNYLY